MCRSVGENIDMLFNSYEFILVFLPLTWLLYFLFSYKVSEKSAKYFLILASLLFYSYWDLGNLPILLVSIGINYVFGVFLSKKRSLLCLSCGVAFNIFFLCYFKYTDFIISNINTMMNISIPLQKIVLPLGISFFTFTQTAYLVDVYRGGNKGVLQKRLSPLCYYFSTSYIRTYPISQGYDSSVFG